MNLPPLLRPGEAARVLGVHPKTVLRWAEEGWLAYQRVGRGHRRYTSESVLALKAHWAREKAERKDRGDQSYSEAVAPVKQDRVYRAATRREHY